MIFFIKINFCISLLSYFRENFLHIINILEFQPWRNEKAGDIWLDEEKRWVLSNGLFAAIFKKVSGENFTSDLKFSLSFHCKQ